MATLNAQHTTKSLVEGLSFFREFTKNEISELDLTQSHTLVLTKRSLNPNVNVYAKFKTTTSQTGLTLGDWTFFEDNGTDLYLFNGDGAKIKFSEDGSISAENDVLASSDFSNIVKENDTEIGGGNEISFTEVSDFVRIDDSLLDVTFISDTEITIKFPFAVDYKISIK